MSTEPTTPTTDASPIEVDFEPVPLNGDICPPGELPATYEAARTGDTSQCIPESEEPCVGLDAEGNGTTLYHVVPCSVPVSETVATVAVAEPPSLPVTGPAETAAMGGIAAFFLAAGIVLSRISKWTRS